MNRVVVTGMSGITSIGEDWDTIEKNLRNKKSGIVLMEDWKKYDALRTKLGGPVTDFDPGEIFNRKNSRTMGRVSFMATKSAHAALADAGLLDAAELVDGSTGIAYGSSTGSTDAVGHFALMRLQNNMELITATSYIQMMSHTCAVNVGLFFKIKGRVITTCSACTSGSQGIGYAYESIKYGLQKIMIAGGAEELCPTEAAVFDTLFATSIRNDEPELTPRPFDQKRDGLVIGEGAGTLILEDMEHARARGARIYAELVGFGTNADGNHVTQPSEVTMKVAMELALKDAGLEPEAISYVNAHATATERGDIAESLATSKLFGSAMPVSSLKSYFGHTLGACGGIDAWLSIEMMNNDWFAPTINLDQVDERCGELDYIVGDGRNLQTEYIMSNNFAFGGINTSLIFKRVI